MTEINKSDKMGQERLCPDGYKNCDGYIIPNEWSVVRFNSLFKRLTRKNTENNQNVLTISAQQGLVSQMDYYNTLYASENKEGYSLLNKGDFSYNKSYSSEYAYGAIKRLDAYDRGIVSPLYICFTPEKETNSDFYLQYFEAGCFNREIYKIAQEGARNHGLLNVSTEDFFNSALVLPLLAEQKRIAEILMQCDKVIELKQKKVDELKQLKKECLRKMFPANGCDKPEIRFPGFMDAWERQKLGELADIIGGGTPSTNIPKYWDGDIDWYSPAEILDQIYVSSSRKKITKQGLENSSAKILPVGTVLFTSRAGIGKTAILADEGCTNQGFQSIVPHENKLDSYFIFSRTEELKRYGETIGAGSTFVEVSGKQMANMDLMMPKTMTEQQSIGDFFRHLDHLITLHTRELDESKTYKKALSQLLLTGAVRVPI